MRRRLSVPGARWVAFTCMVALLSLLPARARAFSETVKVYPGTMCTVGSYSGLYTSHSGSGQVFDTGGFGSECPIIRSHPTWEGVEVWVYMDTSAESTGSCSLYSSARFYGTSLTADGTQALDSISSNYIEDGEGIGLDLTNTGTSSTWWSSFSGSSSLWRTERLTCDAGATVRSYYVYEWTNN